MNWKNLIGMVVPALIPGRSLITGGLEILSEVLGKEGASEEEVYEAIKANPELLKLKVAEVNAAVAERQADSEDKKETNVTMRAEILGKGWFKTWWRPFWGWISAILFFEVGTLLVYIAYQATLGGKPELMKHIPTLVTAFATFFAIPMIVLGVAVHQRSKEKRASLGETFIPRGVIKKLKELLG